MSSRLTSTGKLSVADERALKELEDVRHLFAHNYARRADGAYFTKKNGKKRKRHVLDSGVSMSLSSGAMFDGANISLIAAHLRYYAGQSREIIGKLP